MGIPNQNINQIEDQQPNFNQPSQNLIEGQPMPSAEPEHQQIVADEV